MEDFLDVAGVVVGFVGAVVLAVCAPASLIRRADGSVAMIDETKTARQRIRAYKQQKYGTPLGWAMLIAAFSLQLAAKAVKLIQ